MTFLAQTCALASIPYGQLSGVMDNFFKYASEIISSAAKSLFGLLALVILVVAVLAFFFFKTASERARIFVFLLVFVAASAFGIAVLYKTQVYAAAKADSAADSAAVHTAKILTNAESATSQPPGDDWMNPKWEEARTNIRWVFEDKGAKQTYEDALKSGLSKYRAVLGAQGHNPSAQSSIAAYGEARTEAYIDSLEKKR